jgi:hypothetical protein
VTRQRGGQRREATSEATESIDARGHGDNSGRSPYDQGRAAEPLASVALRADAINPTRVGKAVIHFVQGIAPLELRRSFPQLLNAEGPELLLGCQSFRSAIAQKYPQVVCRVPSFHGPSCPYPDYFDSGGAHPHRLNFYSAALQFHWKRAY